MIGNEELIFEAKPDHACPALEQSLDLVRHDVESWSNEDGDLPVHVQAHNLMASLCNRLCNGGCAREIYNRAQTIGLEIPVTRDQKTLFALVEGTLGTELLFGQSEPDKPSIVEVEIPMASGQELKEIYEKRISIFNEPQLLEDLATHAKTSSSEMKLLFEETLTPVKEDTWDELAKLVQGNVRAALGIMAYFHEVFPLFASSKIELRKLADAIEETGFKPANAWEISAIDVQRLHKFVTEDGVLSVPTSAYSQRWISLAEDDTHIERIDEDNSSITVSRDVEIYERSIPKSLNP